ncbi:hypothetical protein M758_6G202500 [Ceratodon purpureus]|nr:hypothetical protein M758_6G202500 [Ceratodon purpureus]
MEDGNLVQLCQSLPHASPSPSLHLSISISITRLPLQVYSQSSSTTLGPTVDLQLHARRKDRITYDLFAVRDSGREHSEDAVSFSCLARGLNREHGDYDEDYVRMMLMLMLMLMMTSERR